jgi:hypothetical protein
LSRSGCLSFACADRASSAVVMTEGVHAVGEAVHHVGSDLITDVVSTGGSRNGTVASLRPTAVS